MNKEKLSARERILTTATRLFYQYGFQAVGVDTIIAESGVAKMTLYRHFSSKDELIVAYLEQANEDFWEWLEASIEHLAAPKDKLIGIFEALATLSKSPQCLGCTFQVSAAEFPDLEHPAHQVAIKHKNAILKKFESLAKEAKLAQPEVLAEQLLLLMDGAWVAVKIFGTDNPAKHVVEAARALITSKS